ncbi:MAG: hypothetical protein H6738_12775 [Alphaproteobacteria bacterium]|nr:hypothetical protein [Alphaproteobacteria bacterium]MCB9697648.1 hypothetical protein [Alphaproteobacteria bacterium]
MSATIRLCGPLATPHVEGQTLVWSASLALAWRALGTLLGGRPETDDADARSLVEGLGRDAERAEALAEDPTVVARAGVGRAFLETLRADLAARGLPEEALHGAEAWADGIHAYAAMGRRARFAVPFEREERPWPFRGQPVETFGLARREQSDERWNAQREQLIVHYPRYGEDEAENLDDAELSRAIKDFLVELRLADTDEHLFVARIRPGSTLAETVERALGMIEADALTHPLRHLAPGERFSCPLLELDQLVEHELLRGVSLTTAGGGRATLGEVVQHVAFRLDEDGASVRTSSRSSGLSLPPRALDCTGPFLVLWTSAEGAPLCAIWAENTACMHERAPLPLDTH